MKVRKTKRQVVKMEKMRLRYQEGSRAHLWVWMDEYSFVPKIGLGGSNKDQEATSRMGQIRLDACLLPARMSEVGGATLAACP